MDLHHDARSRLIVPFQTPGSVFFCTLAVLVGGLGLCGLTFPGAAAGVAMAVVAWSLARRRTVVDRAAGSVEIESLYLCEAVRSFDRLSLDGVSDCDATTRLVPATLTEELETHYDVALQWENGATRRVFTTKDGELAAGVRLAIRSYLELE